MCAAVATGAGAVLVRDHYDFEDTAAILTLLGACAVAAAVAAAAAVALRAGPRAILTHALTAAALVTPLIGFYYLFRMVTTADYS